MQYTLTINQVKALEWGLNSQQALLFAFVYGCPSWTKPIKTDGGIFFALSKAKIVEELPLLTDKPDTAYRMLKALEEAGLIELSSTSNITLFRLTEKAIEWNQKLDGSEKYPTPPKNKGRKNIRSTSDKSPSRVGKKSEQGSDKSPTNQDTNHQGTNQGTSHSLPEGSDKPTQPGVLVLVG
ncbi:phage replication protein, partial [Pseudomonas poae]|nr:phage replication protein [Pseudomonas poae]